MKKHYKNQIFYDHLIPYPQILTILDPYDIPVDEKQELIDLIDELFHRSLLNLILNHLPKDHHEEFLTRFHQNPGSPDLLIFLKERISIDIEDHIQKHAAKIREDILLEVKKSRIK